MTGQREARTAMMGEQMDDQPLQFECPRCGQPTEARYWGPCPGCRDQLAAAMVGEAREIEVGAFEPTMHVVPNQVATKE
jgi:Zn finger protein HypA/HybF involved in hydrogenase expression